MKRFQNIFLIILLLKISFPVFAQDCEVNFLGTKTLYTPPAGKSTNIPAGYSPVFINYVGRHGARHLTKKVKISFAYQILARADSLHQLTVKGQELLQQVLNLDQVENGNLKSISAEGKAELQGIGQRLVQNNSPVFNQPLNLNVFVTKEIRTAQSADAFFTGVNLELKNKVEISKKIDDTDLRFYDFSPAYDAYETSDLVDHKLKSLRKTAKIDLYDQAFADRIFKADFAKQLNPAQKEKFSADIFGFATIIYSLQKEVLQAGLKPANVNFKSFFTCDELANFSNIDIAEDYLKKGPGTNLNGIQIKIAVPLLINFIKTTDDFLATGKFQAQLRFAHAETILPFATLLNIRSADKVTADLSHIDQVWKPGEIAQLSSNIQWILYRKKGSKNDLVKVLLNENEAYITGLSSKNFPYYSWVDLKNLYLKKLALWHVDLDANMDMYLKQLTAK